MFGLDFWQLFLGAFWIFAHAVVPPLTVAILIAALCGLAMRALYRDWRWAQATAFLAAFAVVGVCVGVLTGASKESLVKDLVPAVLTSAFGFFVYFWSKDASDKIKQILPPSVVVFMISMLFGIFFGFSLKNLDTIAIWSAISV